MVKVELETSTLAVLIAGLYCSSHNTEAVAIPEQAYLEIAKKIEPYLDNWNYDMRSFEEWVAFGLYIYPKGLLDDSPLLKKDEEENLCFDIPNGNVVLTVNMEVDF